MENAKDIISVGFNPKSTFIYSDLKYCGNHFLMNAWEFSKLLTFKYVLNTIFIFMGLYEANHLLQSQSSTRSIWI